MITVVNKRGLKAEAGAVDVYIGRPSPLGNPYPEKIWGRKPCIELFSVEFFKLISTKKNTENLRYNAVRRVLKDIYLSHKAGKHVRLICWCYPEECHGDIIKSFIERLS